MELSQNIKQVIDKEETLLMDKSPFEDLVECGNEIGTNQEIIEKENV